MKETNDVVACVIDFGMFGVPYAERLARKPDGFKKVYLFQEFEEDYTTLNRAIMGDGFSEFERVPDIWSILNDIDLFVCPDVQRAGLQIYLESLGKKVWGSRSGDQLELDRELHLQTLSEVGLKVPPHKILNGINALRSFLRDKQDCYIKVSRYRGSFETCHFRNWKLDESLIDLFAVRFGPMSKQVRFLVFPNIDTPLEIGADTYCVDGSWPQTILHGVEWKDRSYLGAVSTLKEAPRQIQETLSKFGSVLREHRYRNQFSCEIRVKGNDFYFIDPTCRGGLPSTASQLELWSNFPEIVWHGANGHLVEPVPVARFSVECILTAKRDPTEWTIFDVPKSLRQWTKFADCFEYERCICFPAQESTGGDDVGWLVAVGDSIEEVVKRINKQADQLPDGMDANTETLPYVIKEIQVAVKAGIPFGRHMGLAGLPKPAVVFES